MPYRYDNFIVSRLRQAESNRLTAFKTISMRIRGATTEMEEAGLDTEGMASSTAKLREEIMALSGVDIMLDSTTFKSTYKIMEELAAKWQDLTDIQQASVTELIAGKRQGNIVSSLMTNFDIAQEALQTSLNSSGSAMEEHEKYMDSIEAKLNSLKAAWQGFAQTFMDSNLLKGGIDVLTKIIDLFEGLIDNFGLLGTTGLGVGIFGFTKYFKSFTGDGAKVKKTITDVVSAIDSLTDVIKTSANVAEAAGDVIGAVGDAAQATGDIVEGVGSAVKATGNIAEGVSNAVDAIDLLDDIDLDDFDDPAELLKAITPAADDSAKAIGNVVEVAGEGADAIGDVAGAATKATGGFKAFATSAVGIATGVAVAVAAIALIYNQYKKAKEAAAEARQEAIETSNAYLDAATSFEQAYAKYSGKTDLTSEEESELEAAIHGTVDALGDKSSALQDVVNSSNDYLASLERIADAELEAAKNAAETKRDKAILELEESAMGWERFDGSEVNIELKDSEAIKIARKIDSDFVNNTKYASDAGATIEYDSLILSKDADINEIIQYYDFLLEYQEKLSDADLIDTSEYEDVSAAIDSMSESISLYTEGVYEAAKANYQLENGIPKTAEAYMEMRETILKDDEIKNLSIDSKKNIANSLDSDYSQVFDLSTAEVQARKLIGILDEYGDIEVNQMETFLNMRTAVNNNDCTVGEYLSQFSDIENMTSDWSDVAKEELNTSFGLDTDTIKKQYDDVYNYVTRNYLKNLDTSGMRSFEIGEYKDSEFERIKSILDNLTATELQAVVNIKGEIDWENASTDKILAQIKKEAEFIEAMNFTIAIDVETESVDALNSAMAESVSATGLSSESIATLKSRYAELESQGYDLSAMFEETANGIHLNRDAISEFEQAYASQKLSETEDNLNVLKDRYDELTDEINNCTDASERASLYREQQTIAQKINDLGTLAAQYDGLASSYNAWLSAEEAGQERDMYEQIIEGFETIGDEISRGWYDDGTIKFLELIKGETDLAGKSATELKEIWKSLDDTIEGTSYSVKDFFTTDEDGNSTNTGAYNFLKAVEELGKNGGLKAIKDEQGNLMDINKLVERNDDNKIVSFDFNVVGGDKAVADALDVSEEMVQIIQRALDDAGFVVTLDGKWTQFADLKDQAEKANDAIKKLAQTNETLKNAGFGDYEFDFGTSNIETLNKDFEKAKELLNSEAFKNKETGKFDLSIEGAEEAQKIAETLLIAKQQLEEPAYMSIDTTKLQDKLQEPVKLLQSYEEKAQRIELLSLTPDINAEEIKTLNGDLNGIVKQLQELPEEQKIAIGIDGMTPEQIREQLENGTIEVPAELTIEANMDKSLEDLVTLGLLEQGLIDEKTAKIRLGLEVEVDESDVEKDVSEKISEITSKPIMSNTVVDLSSTISKYTEEEQEVVLKFLTDTSEYDDFEAKDKEAVVKFIADSIDVDNYTAPEKEAYAKYIADGGNLDDYTPEEKTAIAKYLVDGGDVESYSAPDQDAIVKFLKNTVDIDNYTPAQKQAIAKFIKDSIDVDNYQMPTNKMAYAKYLKDTYDIDVWTPPVKDGEASYTPSLASTFLPAITGLTAWYTPKIKGGAGVNGTANVNGTAFANGTIGRAFKQGNWGTKDSGTALGGELGREIIVRDGRFFTIGDDGAEFFQYKKGDIIFNHRQSEELLRNGKVTSGGGRGRALANGTAFLEGTAFSKGYGGGEEYNPVTGKTYGSSSSSDSGSEEDFEETIDLIEIAISRIERAIDNLDQKANSVYRSWSERNSNLTSEISNVRSEISLQQQAYQEYLNAAAGVGLSSSWQEKIKNGEVDIETVKDEALAEKIKDYQNWYFNNAHIFSDEYVNLA